MISNEQLVTFIKSKPITVGCAILTVILIAGIYFRSDAVPEAEKILDEKSQLGQRIDANIKNGNQLPEQLAAITAARQEIETRLVHPDELAKNQQFFYKLESDTSVKLVDIRQNPIDKKMLAKNTKPYIPVGYAVIVRGSYPHLLDYLHRLESGQRFCRMVSATINLGGVTDDKRGADLTLNMTLELLGQP